LNEARFWKLARGEAVADPRRSGGVSEGIFFTAENAEIAEKGEQRGSLARRKRLPHPARGRYHGPSTASVTVFVAIHTVENE